MSLTNEANQRGLKDFLTLYNTITGFCFDKCVSNFNSRKALGTEADCIDHCTDNYVQFNQRLMFNFMDHQERRKLDLERAAIEQAAKEAAAAAEQTSSTPDNASAAEMDNQLPQSLLAENNTTSDSPSVAAEPIVSESNTVENQT